MDKTSYNKYNFKRATSKNKDFKKKNDFLKTKSVGIIKKIYLDSDCRERSERPYINPHSFSS